MRYRVVVSRVQVAERFVSAFDAEEAAKKVQEELDKPYGYLGTWRTVDTDLDVHEEEARLASAPPPLPETGTALLSIKQAADYLGLARNAMYQLVHSGEIGHLSVGTRMYISRDAIKDFIEKNTKHEAG